MCRVYVCVRRDIHVCMCVVVRMQGMIWVYIYMYTCIGLQAGLYIYIYMYNESYIWIRYIRIYMYNSPAPGNRM